MRYLGNKESIVQFIFELLQSKQLIKSNLVFFDAFCGMGSVANYLKSFFNTIIINDILCCASTFTTGRLVANKCSFKKLGFDPIAFLNANKDSVKGFFYNTYSKGGSERMYFSEENAARIDFFRKQIEEWKDSESINYEEYQYLLACLLDSVSAVSNTAGVYGAFLKHWDSRALKPIEFLRLHSEDSCKKLIAYHSKIEEIVQDVECDILYLDPPYTQNQYGTQYHLLETLILNDSPTVSKITGSRPTKFLRSDWSKDKKAHILFDRIISKTKARYIILSYNNDGFLSKDFIEATLKRYGKEESYQCITLDYKKYNNFKCQGSQNHVEYLFFIEKKEKEQVVYESPLNYTGSKAKMVNVIKEHLPLNINRFIDVFGGGFNVGINIDCDNIVYNDINNFVVGLIHSFAETSTYDYLSYVNKLIKQYDLSPQNRDGFLKLRNDYNTKGKAQNNFRMLYTTILYSFQQQIRFNGSLEFNNPFGSRFFNDKLLSKFISFSRISKEKNIQYLNLGFEELLDSIQPDDFVYLDPPYRNTLGVYNDGKRGFEGWTKEHEEKLRLYIQNINNIGTRFMLSYVIENEGIRNLDMENWIIENEFRLVEVVNQGRYNKRKEVLILNY